MPLVELTRLDEKWEEGYKKDLGAGGIEIGTIEGMYPQGDTKDRAIGTWREFIRAFHKFASDIESKAKWEEVVSLHSELELDMFGHYQSYYNPT